MVYLVIRKTTDWNDARVFAAQIPAGFAPTVELWDATLTLPYRIFRRELKRIAALTWSRVAGAALVPRHDIPSDGIVVPTDDDDWFSPHLASVLIAHVDDSRVGYHWPSRYLEVPIDFRHRLGRMRRRIFPRTPPQWLCTTNNYALVQRAETMPLLDGHMAASR